MSGFKIATWNVNSLRVRLPQVLEWLNKEQPDALALQETKLQDIDFPESVFTDIGYRVVYSGQRTYNGVAIITRDSINEKITDLPGIEDIQRRVLAVTVNGVRIINLYIPNGESVTSDKFQYKLQWLRSLEIFLKQELGAHQKIIVLGDFNIAPQPIDVHNPTEWEGKVLFSDQERKAFANMLELGFADCFRALNPVLQAYSWWDYRVNAFKRNLGMRIDHILASQSLIAQCELCHIDKTPRSHERPSDHAPVTAAFI